MKPLSKVFVVVYYVLGTIMRILYPVDFIGKEKLPQSGALLCANHSSMIDPVLISLNLPINYRLHVMGKAEAFRIKPLAWLYRKVGGFPVNRGGNDINAIKTSISALKGGDNLLIFVEGTRVKNGLGSDGQPARAKSGAAMIGVRTGAKMYPGYVETNKKLFHRNRVIVGDLYEPVISGRHGTGEEMQKIADDLLAEAYRLGGKNEGSAAL